MPLHRGASEKELYERVRNEMEEPISKKEVIKQESKGGSFSDKAIALARIMKK